MSSVNFNAAANSALRVLQTTNSQLDATQNRISTGLKIGEAKDNAAYWSISTTLKSDNKAMGTVKDALALGSATVDTAYEGLNSTLDVLNEIKVKLTAATQAGIDKAAVQDEISALQEQLKSIANSSTFSGENWLSVNSDLGSYDPTKTIVASFTRNSDGTVSLGTVDVGLGGIALIDASATRSGLLDGGKSGNSTAGALTAATGAPTPAVPGAPATTSTFESANLDFSGLTAGNVIKMGFEVDGNVVGAGFSYTVNKTIANTAEIDAFVTALDTYLDGEANVTRSGNKFVITSVANGERVEITSATAETSSSDNTSVALTGTGVAIGQGSDPAAVPGTPADGPKATTTAVFGGAFTIDSDDTISFEIEVDGGATTAVTIDRKIVDKVLVGANGVIGTAAQYANVVQEALNQAGIRNVTVAEGANNTGIGGSNDTGKLVFSGTNTTADGSLVIKNVTADNGTSVLDMNIAAANRETITRFIDVVNKAINGVTSAAANLGAVAKRVDLQSNFVQNLMDTIDKGVSGLIDADMNEESTKLQALQVKQQLGVQALSIANQSAQNVLSLFR